MDNCGLIGQIGVAFICILLILNVSAYLPHPLPLIVEYQFVRGVLSHIAFHVLKQKICEISVRRETEIFQNTKAAQVSVEL